MQSIKKIKVINSFRNQHNNRMQQNIMLKQQHKIFITKFFSTFFYKRKEKIHRKRKITRKLSLFSTLSVIVKRGIMRRNIRVLVLLRRVAF